MSSCRYFFVLKHTILKMFCMGNFNSNSIFPIFLAVIAGIKRTISLLIERKEFYNFYSKLDFLNFIY